MPEYPWLTREEELTHGPMLDWLDELRREDPILWLVLVGGRPTTPRAIACKLGWPHDIVLRELRKLKREGYVIDAENNIEGRAMVWEVTTRVQELYDWLQERRKGWCNADRND